MTCREGIMTHRMHRREALQIGAGLFGLTLPGFLEAAEAVRSARASKDISCIFMFLAGGPSHFETFDPKPDAPVEIRGDWKPTSTNVPGTYICEKLPLMASRMDKVAVVRSWQGKSGSHSTGSQHVTSGMYPPKGGQYFPNLGCLVSALKGTKVPGIASHYGLPVAGRYTDPTAYLGPAHAAFDVKGDPLNPQLQIDALKMEAARFENRRSLSAQLDNLGRLTEASEESFDAIDKFGKEAAAMLTSGAMQKAMNIDAEPQKLRERYGDNIYGRRVLLSRRLIEAGARFVTINQAVQGGPYGSAGSTTAGTWDNHSDIYSFLMTFGGKPPRGRAAHVNWRSYEGPGNLPQLDMSLSTLLDDLDERGLLDTTLVVAIGEFGRTPKINAKGGRDHYPRAGCAVLAGAGIKGGTVVGATDRSGSEPATPPITPEDFAATIYHALGLDPHRTHFPRITRPTPISNGQVVQELF